ncbi:MAG: hypothetical protein ACP5N1_04325 [Candidatus Woesearchaeota archaeon]
MNKSLRKGQAALEFMMTYGWAILVVLAAIGALSYFGVLNPTRFAPETCVGSTGFSCVGKPVANVTALSFTVVNGLDSQLVLSGDPVNAGYVNISSALYTLGCRPVSFRVCPVGVTNMASASCVLTDTLDPGEEATITLGGCNGFVNSTIVKGDVSFNYINSQSRLSDNIKVTVTAKVRH